MAEGTLVPTPAALVRCWCEGSATGGGLSGHQRLVMTFMELDAAVGVTVSAGARPDIFPPAIIGPASNTAWSAVITDKTRFEAIVNEGYGDQLERTGSNWIRTRWHEDQNRWFSCLAGPVARLRAFDAAAERFSDDELAKALLSVLDEHRTGDEDVNRARLTLYRPRAPQPRLRPHMRLKQLFAE